MLEMMDIDFALKQKIPPTVPVAFESALVLRHVHPLFVEFEFRLGSRGICAVRLVAYHNASKAMFPKHVVLEWPL
jgi:hypothetical protein